MSSDERTRRQSRSSQMKRETRRKSENTTTSELIFVPNKLPADFAVADARSSSAVDSTAAEDKLLQRKPSDEQRVRQDRSVRIGCRRWSIPEGIPNSSLLEHIATSRFFHHYVSPTRTFFRLDLDFTHAVIDGASKRAILAEAIIAMGVLTFPNKDRAAYTAARLRHTRALRLTNKALQNSEYAMSDEILMAVILLGFYETTPDATHSMMSWTSHLDGARHLLRLRGESLLQTGAAYRIFSILRVQILLNCFMSTQKVPQDLVELSDSMAKSQAADERAASQLMSLHARMCNLIASTKESTTPDISNTIAEAVSLDTELMDWAANVPAGFEISQESPSPLTRAYSESYEVFSSIWCAEVWVFYRTARFGVHSLLMSLYSAILAHSPDERSPSPLEQTSKDTEDTSHIQSRMQECGSVLEALRVDLCAAVPYLLGQHQQTCPILRNLPLNKRTIVQNLLVFLTRMPGTSEKMQTWAEELLVDLQAEEEVDKGAIWMNNPAAPNIEQ